MTYSLPLKLVCLLVVVYFSVASGASEITPEPNHAPRANAGLEKTAVTGEVITLDASRSTDIDGDRLSLRWRLKTPAGSGATLDDDTALQPQFTVDILGKYTAELMVSDGKLDSVVDAVNIRTGNVAPVAVLNTNVKVAVGEVVFLDGSKSWDFNDDVLSHYWSLVEAPAKSRLPLQSEKSTRQAFVADVPGDYLIELVVSDGQYRSTAVRGWLSTVNARPQADAGPDRYAYPGVKLQLNGRASADAERVPLAYRWSVLHAPAGSHAKLFASDSVTPVLSIDAPGSYLLQLITHDGVHASAPDTMVITASAPSPALRLLTRSGVQDSDGDGIPDDTDNCVEHANPTQLDSNGDGFGNRCDADLDNDGFITNFGDLVIWVDAFLSTPADLHWNPDADFNGDNVVNFGDLFIFTNFFLGPPGPIVNRFTNPAGGSWHDPANWSLGIVPDTTHSARIDIGTGVSVEYSTGASTIWGLRSTTDFMQTGGDLTISGDLQVDASLTLSGGGTLADANILAPATSDLLLLSSSQPFTFSNVTLGRDMTIESGASLTVLDALTLNTATVTLASTNAFTYLRINAVSGPTATLGGTGEILFGGTTLIDNRNRVEVNGSTDALVIAAGVTIRTDTTAGQISHAFNNGMITLDGTVISDLDGRTVTLSGVPLSIAGALQVSNNAILDVNFLGVGGTLTAASTGSVTSGGELRLRGEWTHAGTISVSDAQLDLGNTLSDSWSNTGTITLNNATLELGGSFTVADIGNIAGTGTVIIDGSLDNTGQTLDLGADLPGTTVLLGQNGAIIGGSIVNTPVTLPAGVSFTFDNVTLGADMTIESGASLTVLDALTLNTATVTLASTNAFTYLRINAVSGPTATLGGTGEILFGGTTLIDNRNRVEVNGSTDALVIAAGVTIRTDTTAGQISHAFNNGMITLDGTVISDLDGRTVTLSGVPLSIAGALQVSNNAILDVNFLGVGGTLTAASTGSVTSGGELRLRGEWTHAGTISVSDAQLDLGNTLSDSWSNTGTITLNNATLELGGSFTVADIGNIAGTGTVIIDGSLDNTGQTLDLGADLPGTTVLLGQNGAIIGGSIVNTPVTLPAGVSFTFDNVTLGADMTIESGASLTVLDALTLNTATVTLASTNSFTYLRINAVSGPTATLGGTGEILFGGTTLIDNRNRVEVNGSTDALVIAAGVTIRTDTTAGQISHAFNNGMITLDGTVISDLDGRTVTLSGVPLSIAGALQVSNNAILDVNFLGVGGTLTAASTGSVTSGGELRLRGEWTHAGTISVSDAQLDLGNTLSDSWSNTGTITLNNATLELGGSFTVADIGNIAGTGTVIIDGSLDNTGQTLDLGADLPGTTVLLGQNGAIIGGSIVNTPVTLPAGVSFTFDNVTLGADMTIESGASLTVLDALTLNTATVTLASTNSFTYLRINAVSGPTATLGGTGEILFGGTTLIDNRNRVEVNGSTDALVIAAGVTIRTDTTAGQISHAFNNGMITLDGTVMSDLDGRTVTLSGVPLSIAGALQVSNNAILDVNFLGVGGTLTAASTGSVTSGGELRLRGEWTHAGTISVSDAQLDLGNTLSDSWSNTGTITLNNATLELGGSFTVADIGNIAGTGTVIIDGSLDNTGQTLDLGADLPGTTVLLGQNGAIIGGSIVNTPVTLPAGVSFTFDNVTLGADMTIESGASLTVLDALTLNTATVTLASTNSFTYLRINAVSGPTATLGGTGEILFGGTTLIDNRNRVEVNGSTDALVIAAGVTIRTDTTAGQISHAFNNGMITLQGTLISDLVSRTVTLSGAPLSIEGTLQAGAGSVFNFASDYSLTPAASMSVDVGGTAVADFGRFTAASRTANLDGTLNISLVNGFTPALSETFEIMSFAASNGTFGTENGTGIGGGLFFQVNYNTADVTLEVVN